MAIQAFSLLKVNSFFNESIYFGNITATEADWKAELT
jgi:hypothetical protein